MERDIRPGFALALALIAAAAAGVYGPFLDHAFQYDDVVKIVDNRRLEEPLGFFRAFNRGEYSEDTTRLIPNLSFSLDRALYGENPLGFHLTNLLFHLLNIVLVAVLGRTVLRRTGSEAATVPLLGAALFALHPLNSEAVDYCNARPNLAATSFYILSLLAMLRATATPAELTGARIRRWALFAAALGCALLSKELAVTVAVTAPLLLVWFPAGPARNGRALVRRTALLFAGLLAAGIAVALATGAYAEVSRALFEPGDHPEGGWAVRLLLTILGQAVVLMRYLGLVLLPLPGFLNVDHGAAHLHRQVLAGGAGDGAFAAGMLAVPALCLAAFLVVAAGAFALRRRAPFPTFFVLWFFIAHAPNSLVPRTEAMVEYRNYLPMAGLCQALAWALAALHAGLARRARSPGPALAGPVAALVLLALLGTGTVLRNRAWATPVKLWQDSADKAPHNPRSHNNLGRALHLAGDTEGAIRAFRRAIDADPSYARAHNNLGNALAERGELEEALRHFQRALALRPEYANAHNNVGNLLLLQRRPEQAVAEFHRSLELDPDSAEAHNNLGRALLQLDRTDEAMRHLRRALDLDPDLFAAHGNIGVALLRKGDTARAVEHFERALAIHPGFADVHNNLGNVLAAQGKLEEAARHFERALALHPGFADAYNNLGNVRSMQGRFDEAIEQYRHALESNPRLADAHNNLGRALVLRNQPDRAVEHYRRALELDPGHAEAHHNLGAALLQLGRTGEAANHFRRALEIRPDYDKARKGLQIALGQEASGAGQE